MANRNLPPRLLLAAPREQYVQKSNPQSRVRRRPRPDQYALYGAPSAFCGAPYCAVRLGLEFDDGWREPRHALYRRLVRPQERARSVWPQDEAIN